MYQELHPWHMSLTPISLSSIVARTWVTDYIHMIWLDILGVITLFLSLTLTLSLSLIWLEILDVITSPPPTALYLPLSPPLFPSLYPSLFPPPHRLKWNIPITIEDKIFQRARLFKRSASYFSWSSKLHSGHLRVSRLRVLLPLLHRPPI